MIIGCKTRRTRGKGVQDGRFHWPGNSVGNGVSRVFLRLALPMVLRLAQPSRLNIEREISQHSGLATIARGIRSENHRPAKMADVKSAQKNCLTNTTNLFLTAAMKKSSLKTPSNDFSLVAIDEAIDALGALRPIASDDNSKSHLAREAEPPCSAFHGRSHGTRGTRGRGQRTIDVFA